MSAASALISSLTDPIQLIKCKCNSYCLMSEKNKHSQNPIFKRRLHHSVRVIIVIYLKKTQRFLNIDFLTNFFWQSRACNKKLSKKKLNLMYVGISFSLEKHLLCFVTTLCYTSSPESGLQIKNMIRHTVLCKLLAEKTGE